MYYVGRFLTVTFSHNYACLSHRNCRKYNWYDKWKRVENLTLLSIWEIFGSYNCAYLTKNSFNSPGCLHLKVENYFNSTTLLFTCRRNILSDSNNGKASLFIVNLSLILRKGLKNIITTLCKAFPLICKQEIPFSEVFPNFSYGKIALKSSPSFCPLWGNFTCFFLSVGALLNIMLLT